MLIKSGGIRCNKLLRLIERWFLHFVEPSQLIYFIFFIDIVTIFVVIIK